MITIVEVDRLNLKEKVNVYLKKSVDILDDIIDNYDIYDNLSIRVYVDRVIRYLGNIKDKVSYIKNSKYYKDLGLMLSIASKCLADKKSRIVLNRVLFALYADVK